MNLPNAITFSRLILTALFVAGTSFGGTAGRWTALVCFVIAAISDWLDGYLARKLGLVTPMGKLMDPLADKVLVCSAFVYLSARGFCPVWVAVVILAREFLVTGLRQLALEAGHVMAADRLGKWKTGLQLTYCITCLVWLAVSPVAQGYWFLDLLRFLSRPAWWLVPCSLWLALTLTLVSGWNYLWSNRALLQNR